MGRSVIEIAINLKYVRCTPNEIIIAALLICYAKVLTILEIHRSASLLFLFWDQLCRYFLLVN